MKYRLPLFSALLLLLVLAAQALGAGAGSQFKAGEELLDAGRVGQAEDVAARALNENPKSAEALDFDARVKFYQGRYADALGRL